MSERAIQRLMYLLVAVALYAGVAGMVYRLRHPWMTETQILLHAWDALTWQRESQE